MNCPCDLPPGVAATPKIVAGLSIIPRQLGGFAEFRAAMLARIPVEPALAAWRARDDRDFGVMLLEMWAYVCDVLALYDEVLAHEAYLRTARRRPSLRRLVELIGYRPRPAVAARAAVALLAEGSRRVLVPAGTAFRSGAFDGEPPHVFELGADTTIHESLNQLAVKPPQPITLSGTVTHFLLDPRASRVVAGSYLLIDCQGPLPESHARRAAAVRQIVAEDGKRWIRVDLDTPVTLANPVEASSVALLAPSRTVSVRKVTGPSPAKTFFKLPIISSGSGSKFKLKLSFSTLTLDAVYNDVKTEQRILVSRQPDDVRWFSVIAHPEVKQVVVESSKFTVGGTEVVTPAVKAPFTQIWTDAYLNDADRQTTGPEWTTGDAPELSVHLFLTEVGRAALATTPRLAAGDPLAVSNLRVPLFQPPDPPEELLLRDAEERGVELEGQLNLTTGVISPTVAPSWSPSLLLPVTAFGNVAVLTRGESVPFEVLGGGDGSVAGQSFTLQKGPLTFLPAPTADNESGLASTLRIRVDGVEWTEVESFFGQGPEAQVYIVRIDDEGKGIVTFGDGVRGARLPSGVNNVVARYRFGAGAKAPPVGSIAQLARPVKGLRAVTQPVAAGGGADAEKEEEIRRRAPRSALLLGRAVSILDMEAAAAATPGVQAATAEWRWDGVRQRPVVTVWYVGSAAALTVRARLRVLTDPSTPIEVFPAVAVTPALALDVETDARRLAADVVAAVSGTLLDEEAGLLAIANLGVGKPLFRSRILADILAVPGALGVRGVTWDGTPFTTLGKTPGAGKYFHFQPANLAVTGSP